MLRLLVDGGSLRLMMNRSGKINTWAIMDLLYNWVNYSSEYMEAGYLIDSEGFVHLRGTILNATDRGEKICQMPQVYTPHRAAYGISLYGGDAIKRLYVSKSGRIILPGGAGSGWVNIDNISWWVGKERLRQL